MRSFGTESKRRALEEGHSAKFTFATWNTVYSLLLLFRQSSNMPVPSRMIEK